MGVQVSALHTTSGVRRATSRMREPDFLRPTTAVASACSEQPDDPLFMPGNFRRVASILSWQFIPLLPLPVYLV